MIKSSPGVYNWYPSSMCSKYYVWFVEMGYPNLDIREQADGEWAIIEYYNSPVIPSLTRWNYVLHGMRNIIPSPGFVTKYVGMLDLRKREAWDLAEAKSQAAEKEHAMVQQHAEDTAERAKNLIMQTPALVERVAKEGVKAIDLLEIRKNIPKHQLIGFKG